MRKHVNLKAYDNLYYNQGQADMDGVMVTVSRQALSEVLNDYSRMLDKLHNMEIFLSATDSYEIYRGKSSEFHEGYSKALKDVWID